MVLRQVKLPAEMHRKAKDLAKSQKKKVQELYGEALEDFLHYAESSTAPIIYVASSRDDKPTSLWFSLETAERVKNLAERDDTFENRIYYTAIIEFAQDKNLV